MTEITIELNTETYNDLSRQADKHGLEVEMELKRIVEESIKNNIDKKISTLEFLLWAKKFSSQVGHQQSDSVDILRELREHS